MLTILHAETAEQIATARQLIEEYAAWLEFKLCFQGFEEEMQSMPGKYAPPAGRLLLALWEGKPAGVIALRPLEEAGLCEMKRLYVRPEFRGHNIGRIFANAAGQRCRQDGLRDYHVSRTGIQGNRSLLPDSGGTYLVYGIGANPRSLR